MELSFRVWMCGGSMESIPCSNVGHIYREFNRFGKKQDPQLVGVDISTILNRNDARVAEVWLDEYKDIFYHFRGSKVGSHRATATCSASCSVSFTCLRYYSALSGWSRLVAHRCPFWL